MNTIGVKISGVMMGETTLVSCERGREWVREGWGRGGEGGEGGVGEGQGETEQGKSKRYKISKKEWREEKIDGGEGRENMAS